MFERILVCLDGSKLAEQILPYAAQQALRFNSKLMILQVMSIPSSFSMASATGTSARLGDIMEKEVQRQESDIKSYLDNIAQPLVGKGIDLEYVILRSSPAGDAIVNYARDNAIDLICIATHGHSGLGRVVFGSVADHVLRESGIPILVIKPQEAET